MASQLLSRGGIRLLSLVGPPGIGKTRLALAVAAELQHRFKDGTFFVDLAPIFDPTLVPVAIAQIAGPAEQGDRSRQEALFEHLRSKQILLVLDNMEQLIAAGPFVASLLSTCPHLHILVTSREALRLRWEHVLPVPPLPIPDPRGSSRPAALASCPAVRLFVQRAQAANQRFTLSQQSVRAVAEICTLLEGVPLAIELAAGYADVMAPEVVLNGLQQQGIEVLANGAQDLPERHRTLRKAIDWSFDLLEPEERRLFKRLGVFARGGTFEAAAMITFLAGETPNDIAKGIASLARKSLLKLQETSRGEQRFRMLEMIREYALQRLVESGEAEAISRQHARYFVNLAEASEPQLGGPQQQRWLDLLDRDHDNMRAALGWLREHGDVDLGLRLGAALWHFWRVRGHVAEGREQLESLLKQNQCRPPTATLGKALVGAGEMARLSGDHDLARARLEEGMRVFRQLDDTNGTAWTLVYLAVPVFYSGDLPTARSITEESLALFRQQADRPGVGLSLNFLGQIALTAGDYVAARSFLEESLSINRELESKWVLGAVLTNLALAALHLGDHDNAHSLCLESLAVGQQLGDRWRIAWALETFAMLAAAQGQARRAIHLAGAGAALYDAISAPLSAFIQAEIEKRLEPARQSLSVEACAAAWVEGLRMSMEDTIAVAIGRESAPAAGASEATIRTDAQALTSRQREVAFLIALGLTNQQIATELVVSPRTVETHVENIRNKLGLASRIQIATWAVQQGITEGNASSTKRSPDSPQVRKYTDVQPLTLL